MAFVYKSAWKRSHCCKICSLRESARRFAAMLYEFKAMMFVGPARPLIPPERITYRQRKKTLETGSFAGDELNCTDRKTPPQNNVKLGNTILENYS